MVRSSAPDAAVTSIPFHRMRPAVGSISRLMQRSSVDLPEPLRPITARNSPSCTSKLTSRKACVPLGYVLTRCSTFSIGAPYYKNEGERWQEIKLGQRSVHSSALTLSSSIGYLTNDCGS